MIHLAAVFDLAKVVSFQTGILVKSLLAIRRDHLDFLYLMHKLIMSYNITCHRLHLSNFLQALGMAIE